MADNTVRGRFVWHELMTPNGAGAHEFYSKAFGWKTQNWEHDTSYSMFAASTGPLGASVEKRDGTPQWIAYIATTNVDEAVEAAQRQGAAVVVPPTTIPNAGRHAVLTDPQGATFGVHASEGESRPDAPAQFGEFSWHELATNADPEQAFAFYSELFGWDAMHRHDMGPSGIYVVFGRNGRQLGGMFNKGDMGKPGPAYWVGYVRVKNADEAVETIKGARGTVLTGPMDVPGGDRVAQLADPHGAFFAVHQSAQDVQAAAAPKPAAKPPKAAAAKPPKVAEAKPPKVAEAKAAPKAAQPPPQKAAKPAKKKAAKAAKKPAKKPAKKAAKKGKKAKQGAKPAAKKAKRPGAKKAAKKGAKKKAAKRKVGKKKAQKKGKKRR